MHPPLADGRKPCFMPWILDVANTAAFLHAVGPDDNGFAFAAVIAAAVVGMIEMVSKLEPCRQRGDSRCRRERHDRLSWFGKIGVVDWIEKGEDAGKVFTESVRLSLGPLAFAFVAVPVTNLDVDFALAPFGIALAFDEDGQASPARRQEFGQE